ncbi:MAG: hypothetical protein ACXVAM_16215, partial [Vulcanimicrobiaceae bacterium]
MLSHAIAMPSQLIVSSYARQSGAPATRDVVVLRSGRAEFTSGASLRWRVGWRGSRRRLGLYRLAGVGDRAFF